MESLSSEEVLGFLTKLSDGRKKATKRTRFATLTAFFNFKKNSYQSDLKNPCDSPMLRKLFRAPSQVRWDFLEKETVDEVIFKVPRIRDRLLVELMARGGLRVSEALKLTPRDVEDRRPIRREPISGREEEVVFIPQKVAERLKGYIRENGIALEDRIFPIGYRVEWTLVTKYPAVDEQNRMT